MALMFSPLSGMTVITELLPEFLVPVETPSGYQQVSADTFQKYVLGDLETRVVALENGTSTGGTEPPVSETNTTLTLTGVISGAALLDGSTEIQLATTFTAGSLTVDQVAQLPEQLADLGTRLEAVESHVTNDDLRDTELSDRVTALEQAPPPVTDLTNVNQQLSDHETRIGTLEQAPAGGDTTQLQTDLGVVQQTVADHTTRLEALEADPDEVADLTPLTDRVVAVETEITALKNTDVDHTNRITALEAGGGSGGGSTAGWANWTYVAIDTLMEPGVPYLVDASAGTRNMTIPATVEPGHGFVVWAYGGNVNILSNGNEIGNLGVGNDLGLINGEVVSMASVGGGKLVFA